MHQSERPQEADAHQATPVSVEGGAVRKLGEGATPDPGDRRRSERRTESASGWLSSASGGTMTSGRTVAINDLSLHGVGFTSRRPCEVGDRHWLLITRGAMRLSTRVRVASVRERADGQGWDVGGEFF